MVLTLNEMRVALVLEGSGDAGPFDGRPEEHQHFKCVKCKRIVDFDYKPFDNIRLLVSIDKMCKALEKSLHVEGIFELCK